VDLGAASRLASGGSVAFYCRAVVTPRKPALSFIFFTLALDILGIGLMVVGSLGGITGPAVQGLISRSVGADEQGGVQGSLAGLASVAGILGPPLSTTLFSHFISDGAAVKLPGAAFFSSALLVILALMLAVKSFRRHDDGKASAAVDVQAPKPSS
jgi:DHA1 family tetracycline resistance protein-like MFS transporter